MLTKHQSDVLDKAMSLLRSNDRLLVKGSAGVGKTYFADYLEMELAKVYGQRKTFVAAPTHKALSVLRCKIDVSRRPYIEFVTAHSAMKLKRFIDFKTGDVSFHPSFSAKFPPLKGVKVFILDEASMIQTELLEYIEQYATKFGCKVIFLGDEKQLNPVGEDNSPVFHQRYPEVELTEIIRQGKGSPIIDLSRNLSWIHKKQEHLAGNKGYTYTYDRSRIINSLAEVNGTNELKYLAWTNKEVDNVNFLTRNKIYTKPGLIEPGESLIFNSPYREQYHTNEEVYIEDVEVVNVPITYIEEANKRTGGTELGNLDVWLYVANPGTVDNGNLPNGILVIHEQSKIQMNKLKTAMKAACKKRLLPWTDFYNFFDQFADVKYNHAITIHKSQGSTYGKTILNIKNVMLNRNNSERERLFYTGVTRAADLLILYNV